MSNEATVRTGLTIQRSGNVNNYNPPPANFRADVSLPGVGPTPGYLSITTTGESVSFAELITPGLCKLTNLDTVNYVEYGILVGALFYPLGEILAGESYVIRFSRNLEEADMIPGTGSSASTNSFYLRANTATCGVLVEAFEK